jgi:hypothetical protein
MLIAAAFAATLHTAPAPAASAATVPRLGHVFVIIGENTAPEELTAHRAPYITRTLRPRAAWVARDRAFHGSESLGNYMGLMTGHYSPCEAQDGSPSQCARSTDSLYAQLERTGHSWGEWDQSARGSCDTEDHGAYVAHHAPAVYLGDVCSDGDHPLSAFGTPLAAGNPPSFNFIVPDNCHNGHDVCGGDPVRAFDGFLAREIPRIQASRAYQRDGTIVVTWDEGSDADPDAIALLAIGHHVRRGTIGGRTYGHYDLLRTLEDGFRLPALGHAKTARPIPMFR